LSGMQLLGNNFQPAIPFAAHVLPRAHKAHPCRAPHSTPFFFCSDDWGDDGFAFIEATGLDGDDTYGTCFMYFVSGCCSTTRLSTNSVTAKSMNGSSHKVDEYPVRSPTHSHSPAPHTHPTRQWMLKPTEAIIPKPGPGPPPPPGLGAAFPSGEPFLHDLLSKGSRPFAELA